MAPTKPMSAFIKRQFTSLGRPDPIPGINKKRSERFRCTHCQWEGCASSPSRLNDHLSGCLAYQLTGAHQDAPQDSPSPHTELSSTPQRTLAASPDADDDGLGGAGPSAGPHTQGLQHGPAGEATEEVDGRQDNQQTQSGASRQFTRLQFEHRRVLEDECTKDYAKLEKQMQQYARTIEEQQRKYEEENKQRRYQHLQDLIDAQKRDCESTEAEQKRHLENLMALGKMRHDLLDKKLQEKREILMLQLKNHEGQRMGRQE